MFSRKSTRQTLLVLLAATFLLTSCNIGATPAPTLDLNAMNTAIVGTTVAQLSVQFTETALAAPTDTATPTESPTSTPANNSSAPTTDAAALPTFSFNNTPVAGSTQVFVLPTSAAQATVALGDACNNSVFEADVTIPDGTVLKPGFDFTKTWKIRNTGSCKWDEGYTLVYIGGSTPDLDPINFEFKNSSDFVAGGDAINIAVNLTTPCTPGKYEGTWRMRDDSNNFFGQIVSVYVEVKEKC